MATNYCVAAVEKAIRILNFLAAHPNSTFTDIHTALELSKATTYQTLFTLESYQYVTRIDERRYQIGSGVFPLIRGATQPNNLINAARDPLSAYAAETGLTVHLCAFIDTLHMVCLFKIDGVNFTIRNTAVGQELTRHTSAAAKVLLAWLPPEQLVTHLSNITYTKYTETTITSPVVFRQELIQTKQRGYSIDNCEGVQGFMGIGVPVMDSSGNVIAAVSLGAVITEIPTDQYDKYAKRLQEVAATISSRLTPTP